MKKIFISLLCALPLIGFGQNILFYNDGAMVKVQAGATLYIQGGIQNTSTGTIDNDGTIDIEGNFVNAGTWEPSQPNTLRFSGTGNSDVTSGSAVFQTVEVTKVGNNVTLLDPMTVNTDLNFNSAGATNINIGNFNLNIGSGCTVTGADINEFVVTNGTGKMNKTYSALGSFDFPVGFTAATYNPATINVTAGPNDTYGVRVLVSPTDGNGLTGTPITSHVVDAVWDINETTVGGNTANLTLGWQESDELTNFNDLLNCVSWNDGTNGWDGLFANLGPEVSNTRTRNGLTGFGAFAVGGKSIANQLVVAPKVFLQGPYSGGLMKDDLRTLSYIPLSEPYSVAPFNYSNVGYGGGESVPSAATFDQPANGDDVVDWVMLEIRDAVTPSIKLATRAALIQRDGDIVDLDGISNVKMYGLADGTYHFKIHHRNHLGARTATALALSNTVTNLNFTVAGFAYSSGSPASMVDLGSGVMGLWTGDASGDKIVRVTPLASPPFTASDRTYMLNNALGGNPNGQLNAYDRSDINMDGKVRVTPLAAPPFTPSDATIILNSVLLGNPNGSVSEQN